MADRTRLNRRAEKILRAMLVEPGREWTATDLTQAARIGSGTAYPALARFEGDDWIALRWEQLDPASAGRLRRVFYRLTDDGIRDGGRALAEIDAAPRPSRWRWFHLFEATR